MKTKLQLYDTTLRDGEQGPGIYFSAEDKIRIIRALDEFGVSYIEAGNPAANEKDAAVFSSIGGLKLKHAKLAAFGSTCRPGKNAGDDDGLRRLAAIPVPCAAIFGKSSVTHTEKILRASKEENLRIIRDSLTLLSGAGKEVFFDAEHFFDGFAEDSGYALTVIRTAAAAGASAIVLCDTNGGALPAQIGNVTRAVVAALPGMTIGIHCHNDAGLALASTIEAVQNGALQVQGTINGMGERCGNTNLSVLIPTLQLKLGYEVIPPENLAGISRLSRLTAEIANQTFDESMPYVGSHAFTHKAGMHIDAVRKYSPSFEHIDPPAVGNERNTLISGLAGRSALLDRAAEIEPALTRDSEMLAEALAAVKESENEGCQYEDAEGSLLLLLRKSLGKKKTYFTVETFRVVLSEPRADGEKSKSGALIKVTVGGREEITAAEGDGPVNALDRALRKALATFYPKLSEMRLTDFKVRVLNGNAATSAKVRVIIESSDNERVWRTVGVSTDIIEASWKALTDSVEYKLMLDELDYCSTD